MKTSLLAWPWRPSPLLQMTLALVSLCGMMLVLADLLLGVFPDPAVEQARQRKQLAEAMAVQVAALLKAGEGDALQTTLRDVVARTPGVRSVGLRRADGVLVLKSGGHDAAWLAQGEGGASTEDRIDVPMSADGRRWGAFEIAFAPDPTPWWMQLLRRPLFAAMLFMGVMGMMVFSLYMRRALQHLDPSQVIPERVQGAFDAMAEGVAVLDLRGRLLLSNRAFRALNELSAQVKAGQSLSGLPWLSNLGSNVAAHPWMRAMGEKTSMSGQTVEVELGQEQTQHLVINAAPILDAGGRVRGCLTTFSDVTPLHRANLKLQKAMDELNASQDQVKRQNEELRRLATRDPMTGCLNRRAFNESFELMFEGAREGHLPLSAAVLDIDFFKKVNDTHGHSIGDRVIQEVAKTLQALARASDLVCRYGGEEFVVVMPGLGSGEARFFAEQVRLRVQDEVGARIKEVPGMRVTVSIGVAVLSGSVATPLELIDRADHALYEAKHAGRNRVGVDGVPFATETANRADALA